MKNTLTLIVLLFTTLISYAQDDSRIGVVIGKNTSIAFNEELRVESTYSSLYLGAERLYMFSGNAALGYGLRFNKNEVSFNEKRFLGNVMKESETVENYTGTIFVKANSYFADSNLFGGILIGYEFGIANWDSERVPPKGWDVSGQVGFDIHIGDDYVFTPGASLGKRFLSKGEDDFEGFDYSLQVSMFYKFW